jgi:hypothetical protein
MIERFFEALRAKLRPMKKFLKIIMWIFIAGIALMALAALAIRLFLPPEKAKSLLQKELSSRLGREVELGTVKVGLSSGIEVNGFKVSEMPTFENGTFVSSSRFVVQPLWPMLLAKKVVIQNIALDEPHVTVIRDANGDTFNFSDLIASTTTAPAAQSNAREKPAFDVMVLKASLNRGRLNFIDNSPAQHSLVIDELNFQTQTLKLDAPVAFQTSFKLETKGEAFYVDMNARAGFDGNLTLNKVAITSEKMSINVSGKISNLTADQPNMALAVNIDSLDMKLLPALAPLPAGVLLTGVLKGSVDIQGTSAQMRLKPTLDLSAISVKFEDVFIKKMQTPFLITADFALGEKNLAIQASKLTMGPLVLESTGTIKNFKEDHRVLSLRSKSNNFNLVEVMDFFPVASKPDQVELLGAAQIEAVLNGTTEKLYYQLSLNGTDLMVASSDTFKKTQATPLHVDAKGLYTPATLTTDIALHIAGEKFNISAKQITAGKNMGLTFHAKSAGFALQNLAPLLPVAIAYKPTGNVTLDIKGVIPEGKDLDITAGAATLKNVGARLDDFVFSDINAPITFTLQALDIPSLTGKLNDAPMSLATTVKGPLKELLEKPTTSTGKATFNKVSHPLLTANNINLTWNVKDATADMAHITGQAALRVGNGQVKKPLRKKNHRVGPRYCWRRWIFLKN